MGIRIGSKVKFLNAVGGGTVKGFSDDKTALIETVDGFDIPVLVTDLILESSDSYDPGSAGSETEHNEIEPAIAEIIKSDVSFEDKKYAEFTGEILLAIVPENDQILHVSNLGLYVINDSNYYMNYIAGQKDSGVYAHISTGIVEPDTKLEIARFSQTDISKISDFMLQGTLYKHGLFQPVEPYAEVFNIEKINFYKMQFFKTNDYFHKKALIFRRENEQDDQCVPGNLTETDWSEIINQKEGAEEKVIKKSTENIHLKEIDLHIEELVETHAGLKNSEILNIQLSKFKDALESALQSEIQKIVFIHGIGNGILKYELRKKLDKDYPELRYQDASFKEYGFGATMVYLK